jgi:pyruvate/2-oxoglutarate dehydrogenase complex dihydrolipoamide dehydrogenase (E3) component
MARRSADYGVLINGAIDIDMTAVKARKGAVSGKSKLGLESYLKSLKGCTVYENQAQFISANEVAVGDQVLTGDKIFINVGGRALVPKIPGLDQIHYLTNSSMLKSIFSRAISLSSAAVILASSLHKSIAVSEAK